MPWQCSNGLPLRSPVGAVSEVTRQSRINSQGLSIHFVLVFKKWSFLFQRSVRGGLTMLQLRLLKLDCLALPLFFLSFHFLPWLADSPSVTLCRLVKEERGRGSEEKKDRQRKSFWLADSPFFPPYVSSLKMSALVGNWRPYLKISAPLSTECAAHAAVLPFAYTSTKHTFIFPAMRIEKGI